MRLLLLVFLITFVNFTSMAQDGALNWPAGLFQASTLQRQFFNPFKNYFTQVLESHALMSGVNSLTLFEDNEPELQIYWSIENYGVSVYYRTSEKTFSMLVEAEGDLDPMKLALFDFSSLESKDEFRILFPDLDYSFTKEKRDNKDFLTFSPQWGSIYFFQKITDDELESRMWYQCSECSGEPVWFRYQRDGLPNYYIGQLVQNVSPQRYLNIANRYYLSGITSHTTMILARRKVEFGFPKTVK